MRAGGHSSLPWEAGKRAQVGACVLVGGCANTYVVRCFLYNKILKAEQRQWWFSLDLGFHIKILVFMCDAYVWWFIMFLLHMFTIYWTYDEWMMEWYKCRINGIIRSLCIRKFHKGYPRIYASMYQESSVWVLEVRKSEKFWVCPKYWFTPPS